MQPGLYELPTGNAKGSRSVEAYVEASLDSDPRTHERFFGNAGTRQIAAGPFGRSPARRQCREAGEAAGLFSWKRKTAALAVVYFYAAKTVPGT